jgi:alpha-amylase/alpha-mannosidase (GH57 family)
MECYRPNAFARVPDGSEAGERVVNNFERMSFNVGPTLLNWMQAADPDTYERILEADRRSIERLGNGNAMAQAYHHSILPLSPPRDVRTEIRWGLRDFELRYERPAEGMWVAETAANHDVLEALIEEGVRFTVLAPGQAGSWREAEGEWVECADSGIDTRIAYRYMHRDGSGRSIALFFYDGDISKSIAFEKAARSSTFFLDLFQARDTDDGHLVHAATDGETYGHHAPYTELGLAYALFVEAEQREIQVTNYATYLDEFPPEREVRLVPGEGSSWSCAHGVGRWKRNCGCHTGGQEGWTQEWRGPLRDALDVVRRGADEVFDRLGTMLFNDPWGARDRYVDVVIGRQPIAEFLTSEAGGPSAGGNGKKMEALLELQHNALAMYTSCGWFFNDVAGIETVQILRYASRALDLMESLGQPTPEAQFVSLLGQAESNDPKKGTAADLYGAIGTATSAA